MARDPSTLKVEVVGDASKLNKTLDSSSQKMQRWGKNIGSHGKSLTKWVSGPIAGAIGGVAALAKKEGERADALLDAEAATGTSTETLQEFQHVASQAGVAEEFFSEAAKDVQRQLSSASDGTGRAAEAFEDLGVKTHDANGNLRESGAVTEEAIDKLAGIEDEGKRAAIAQDIFKGSSQEMMAVVSQGSDEIARQRDEAHELGAVQSGESLQGANKFRQGLEKLSTQFSGLLSKIGGKFAPLLTDNVLPLFQDKLVPAIQGVADKIAGLVEWFTSLSPKTQAVIAAVAGLVAALGPLLVVVGAIVSAIGTLMPVLGAVAGAISLPVVAIGALVAGLVLAYTKSETFRDVVQSVFSFVKDFITDAIEFVKGVISAGVDVATAVWERWGDRILAFATRTWNNIKQMIGGVLDVITGIFDVFAGLFTGDWDRLWEGVKSIASGIWSFLEGLWDQFLNTLTNLGTIALEALQGLWQRVWTAIKDWVSDRLDDVVGFIRDWPDNAKRNLSAAWETFASFWRGKFRAVKDFVSDRIDDVIGFVTDLPARAASALSSAWETFREVQNSLFGGMRDWIGDRIDDVVEFVSGLPGRARTALISAWSTFRDGARSLFGGIKDWIGDRIDDVVSFFADLPDRIWRKIQNVGSRIKEAFSFDLSIGGEAGGPGDGRMPPGGSVIDRLNAYMDSTGIAHRTTSTFRPGDDGFHGMGRAVDFAGRVPGRNTPNLRAIQQAWVPLAASGRLRELIGPDPTMNFKNGRRGPGVYPPDVQEAHENHVHTAMRAGGMIVEPIFGVGASGRTYSFGEEGPETVRPGRDRGGSDGAAIGEIVEELRELRRELGRPNVTLQSTGDLGDDAQHARLAFMRR